MHSLLEAPWTSILGWTLLHFVWQGLLVHGLLSIALRFVAPVRSELRYALGCTALVAMVVLPAITAAHLAGIHTMTPTAVSSPQATQAESGLMDARGTSVPLDATTNSPSAAVPTPGSSLVVSVATGLGATADFETTLRAALPWLVAAWLTGANVLLLRLIGGWFFMHRLRTRHVHPAPAWLSAAARDVATRLRLHSPVRVMQSSMAPVPMVVGILKPVILVPTAVVTGLSLRQLEMLLAHELAHVRRFDPLVNVLQCLIEALLFYHPSVWAVSRVVRREREHCCDDAALNVGNDRLLYARTLGDLAALPQPVAITLRATGGSLLTRVRRILGAHDASAPHGLGAAAGLIVVALLMFTASTVAQPVDPYVELTTNPALSRELGVDEFAQVLQNARDVDVQTRIEFLHAVAPYAPANHRTATQFLLALTTLPERDMEAVLERYVAAAAPDPEEAQTVTPEPAQEPVAMRTSTEPNFRSVGVPRGPLLEPGFDLGAAGLAAVDGVSFPSGRQFVVVRTRGYRPEDSNWIDGFDLDEYRPLGRIDSSRLHIVVAAAHDDADGSPVSAEQLRSSDGTTSTQGPWNLWVDDEGTIARLASYRQTDERSGQLLVAWTTTQYVCVDDGVVLGSLLASRGSGDAEYLNRVFDACIADGPGDDWLPTPYVGDRSAPAFELHDGRATTVSLEDLRGRPFVLLAPAPMADQETGTPPGTASMFAAEPTPRVRVEQVRALLDTIDPRIELIVVALPYAHGEGHWRSDAVAASLREQLDVPVYEDATHTLVSKYDNFLSGAGTMVLVDARGQIVDGFVERPSGSSLDPWFAHETVGDAVGSIDLFANE